MSDVQIDRASYSAAVDRGNRLQVECDSLRRQVAEWERGDVGRANLAMADRCIVAERETLDLRAKLAAKEALRLTALADASRADVERVEAQAQLATAREDLEAVIATAGALGMTIEVRPDMNGYALTNVRAVAAEAQLEGADALRSERDRAEQHQKTATEAAHALLDRAEKAEAQLATARALNFEEAARKVADYFKAPDVSPVLSLNVAVLVSSIRETANLPPGLVAIRRETLEKVREALGELLDVSTVQGHIIRPDSIYWADLKTALALLNGVGR